jgi:hypothetical protein
VIDHCPTGPGVPRTHRLLIVEAGIVNFDCELGAGEQFDEIFSAVFRQKAPCTSDCAARRQGP